MEALIQAMAKEKSAHVEVFHKGGDKYAVTHVHPHLKDKHDINIGDTLGSSELDALQEAGYTVQENDHPAIKDS